MAKALRVPANVTLLSLPPYGPEPNPAERVGASLRSHYLANRAYTDAARLKLDARALKTVCRRPWIERAIRA